MNDAKNHLGGRAESAQPLRWRSRSVLRTLTLLAVFWAGSSVSFAAEPTSPAGAPPEPAKPQAAQPQAPAKPDAKPDATKPTSGAKPAAPDPQQAGEDKPPQQSASSEADEEAPPPAPQSKGPSPQRFVPSEQVRADFDVSFPIDI